MLKERDWERFTTDSGKPGWAMQWSTWAEARVYMKTLYEHSQKPTMFIDNITKPSDDHYNNSCFFLLHALRMNNTKITVSADSRENAEAIENMNMPMLSVWT